MRAILTLIMEKLCGMSRSNVANPPRKENHQRPAGQLAPGSSGLVDVLPCRAVTALWQNTSGWAVRPAACIRQNNCRASVWALASSASDRKRKHYDHLAPEMP